MLCTTYSRRSRSSEPGAKPAATRGDAGEAQQQRHRAREPLAVPALAEEEVGERGSLRRGSSEYV